MAFIKTQSWEVLPAAAGRPRGIPMADTRTSTARENLPARTTEPCLCTGRRRRTRRDSPPPASFQPIPCAQDTWADVNGHPRQPRTLPPNAERARISDLSCGKVAGKPDNLHHALCGRAVRRRASPHDRCCPDLNNVPHDGPTSSVTR